MIGMAEVTWEDAKLDLGVRAGGSIPDELIERLFDVSKAYVDDYVGVQVVAEVVTNEAILTGVRELNKRRDNPQGSSQSLDALGNPLPFRLSKDAFITVRVLLDPYMVVGF